MRTHLHVLIIVPLVVIATTWPTFPRIFDADEFWLHVEHNDKWLRIWDAWHLEQVFAGRADLFHTDSWFHPLGHSLRFHSFVYPHALLLIALKTVLPVDDAYNLLFLLILCFNGFGGYALIRHLIKDKWIALFGAVVFAVATPFPLGQTVPDLIMIGTLPLTLYFFFRSIAERSVLFGVFAGLCAGITAFISVYVCAFILLSVGVCALFEGLRRWRERAFWRSLLLFVVIAAGTSALRFYPMLSDRADLELAREAYQNRDISSDVLRNFVLPNNPITGHLFGAALDPIDDYVRSALRSVLRKEHKEAYLGYINLVLMAFAFLLHPRRRRLLPWLAILLFFATLRLGDYLTFNGTKYTDIVLPLRLLEAWFPALFGNIGHPEYYQIGVVAPLAVLSSYGLAGVLRSKGVGTRRLIALLCILIVCIEFYTPRIGETIPPSRTAFAAWLQSESEDQIVLINLPLVGPQNVYFSYQQSLTGYPQLNGGGVRLKDKYIRYLESNLLLRTWTGRRSVRCLAHNKESFTAALDRLLADGFTHIVVHHWFYGDQFIIDSFRNAPPAYDDGAVSVYRTRDLRLSCQNQAAELPRFIHFAQSSAAMPGAGTSILSLHPNQAIDPDLFDYLGSLFSDWASLLHLYWDKGELATQNVGKQYANLQAFADDNQVIHFLYNRRDSDPDRLIGDSAFDGFNRCQRDEFADGAVIELYVNRAFSCELVIAGDPFQARYDNGFRLENLEIQTDQDALDLQFMWSNLPDEAHSVSIQIFDEAGEKALGQDFVIGHLTLDRQRVDISSLAPGDYQVKLILYDFETGAVVSGTTSRDGARVDHALEVAAIQQS